MEKAIDQGCRVVGMGGLRIVDPNIIQLPPRVHYQATVYALAENATDSIYAVFSVGVIVVYV